MAAWEKAGGDSSPLGARKGDVYPVGDGFALDFDGGKMFYTTDTGAKFVYGPILDKYESLGGPADSDLGFPTINEVPGLAGPDSRVATFSASDKPVIFWTPDHGAFVVRGAMNAAWDKLGSSGGVLGAPVGDETYDGEVTSQKFSGGEISWNRKTKEFTTNPPVLADQLKGLQVAIDPTAAINMAWRAAGGASGPLGAKQGGQYPIGGDGIAQNFAGGKVFFSPATGANAVESDILAKYESLGGPVGSDLGFPIANESDGGIPSSRISAFAAADKPVIFWTSEHGAFVVRGAMKAAWDKLRGPSGKLGRTARRSSGGRRRGLPEVRRRQDLVEPREKHVHHRPVQPGAVAVRSASLGAEPAKWRGDAFPRQEVRRALVVPASHHSARGIARVVAVGGVWAASASRWPGRPRLQA